MAQMKFSEDEQKKQWMLALTPQMVSSEESCEEDNGGDHDVLLVKHLPWRSERVNTLFARLDGKRRSGQSAQARRQSKKRVYDYDPSCRPQPTTTTTGNTLPAWLFSS